VRDDKTSEEATCEPVSSRRTSSEDDHMPKMGWTPIISVKNAEMRIMRSVTVIIKFVGPPPSRLPVRRASQTYAGLTAKNS
jgi:hypothetical protein